MPVISKSDLTVCTSKNRVTELAGANQIQNNTVGREINLGKKDGAVAGAEVLGAEAERGVDSVDATSSDGDGGGEGSKLTRSAAARTSLASVLAASAMVVETRCGSRWG